MKLEVNIEIDASQQAVWAVITNIENSEKTISGIEKVEVLEKPSAGLVGLKWRETRTMFGKTATEVMWITHEQSPEYYQTRAESHGAVYITRLSVSPQGSGSVLNFEFEGQAQTLGAKIMSALMSGMMKSATRKALEEDLRDIKAAAESRPEES